MSEVEVEKPEEEAAEIPKVRRKKLQKIDLQNKVEKKCVVMGCPSTSKNDLNLRFCVVPRNMASHKFKKWADFAQNPAIFEFKKFKYMCEKHFSPVLFTQKGGRKLNKRAFPTIDGPPRQSSIASASSTKKVDDDLPTDFLDDFTPSDDRIDTSAPRKRTYRKKPKIFTIKNLKKKKLNNKTSKDVTYLLSDHGYFTQRVESEDEDSEYEVLDENQATERINNLTDKVEMLKMENFKMSRELKTLREQTYSMSVFSPDENSDVEDSDDDDYEFLNKQECEKRIGQLEDKVRDLSKEVVDLRKENVILKTSVNHLRNLVKTLEQCGRNLVSKANAISQLELAAHHKEKESLEKRLAKITRDLISTKEENRDLKMKIEKLQAVEEEPEFIEFMMIEEPEPDSELNRDRSLVEHGPNLELRERALVENEPHIDGNRDSVLPEHGLPDIDKVFEELESDKDGVLLENEPDPSLRDRILAEHDYS